MKFVLLLASLTNIALAWSPWGRAWGGQRRYVSPRAYPMWGGYNRSDRYDRLPDLLSLPAVKQTAIKQR